MTTYERLKKNLYALHGLYVKGFKYIALSANGYMYAYKEEPYKNHITVRWEVSDSAYNEKEISSYINGVPKMLAWDDEEPTNIAHLLEIVRWCLRIVYVDQERKQEADMNMGDLKKLQEDGFKWLACDLGGEVYAYKCMPQEFTPGKFSAPGAIRRVEKTFSITNANSPLPIENFIHKDIKPNTLKENTTNNNKHDDHYKALDIEPWDIMKADFTKEELKGFFKGNILKYLLRNKEGVKDVDKLINYAQELKKLMESEEKDND